MRKKLGECLIQAGLITEADLRAALAERRRTGERLGGVLVRLKMATEEQIARALADQLGFRYVNLTDNPVEPAASILIPKEFALEHVCIGVALENGSLTVEPGQHVRFRYRVIIHPGRGPERLAELADGHQRAGGARLFRPQMPRRPAAVGTRRAVRPALQRRRGAAEHRHLGCA